MADHPLTIHITWIFPPEQVAEFFEALYPLKEKLVQEDECLYFNVFETQGQPGVVRLVEMWDCEIKWMVEVFLPHSSVPVQDLQTRVLETEMEMSTVLMRGEGTIKESLL